MTRLVTLSLLLLVTGLWFAGLMRFIDLIPAIPQADPSPTDAVVVLTGGAGRLGHGLELLNDGKAKKLLISGVGKDTTLRDLQKLYPLETRLLPQQRDLVVLDTRAESTLENAEQTAQWMRLEHYRSLRLVTAAYHMPRSLLIFTRALPGVTILPDPAFPKDFRRGRWWTDMNSLRLVVVEYDKYLLTWLGQLIAER